MPSAARKHHRKTDFANGNRCNTRGWKSEKKEHPWTTKKQAKQIACDHNRRKKK